MKSFSPLIVLALVAVRHARAQGAFNVLSMNVAGLPEILNGNGESGDKTTNTMIIGQVGHQLAHVSIKDLIAVQPF
jgi:hypothetical protein